MAPISQVGSPGRSGFSPQGVRQTPPQGQVKAAITLERHGFLRPNLNLKNHEFLPLQAAAFSDRFFEDDYPIRILR